MNAPRRNVVVGTVILATLVCLLVFVALASVALQPGVPSIDLSLSSRLHEIASPAMDQLLSVITDLGSTGVLILVALVAAVALELRGKRAQALFVVLAVVATLALNGLLKLIIARPRPESEWAGIASGTSFPSGHSMNAFVVYVALALVAWQLWGRRVGIVALVLALMLATAVGVSRIYLGVHWPTDVMGGFVAGILCLLIVGGAVLGVRWIVRSSSTERTPPSRSPGASDDS